MGNWMRDRWIELSRSAAQAEDRALRRFMRLMKDPTDSPTSEVEAFFRGVQKQVGRPHDLSPTYIEGPEFEADLDAFAAEMKMDLSLIQPQRNRQERVRLKSLKVLGAIRVRIRSSPQMLRSLSRQPRLALALKRLLSLQEIFDLGKKARHSFRGRRPRTA